MIFPHTHIQTHTHLYLGIHFPPAYDNKNCQRANKIMRILCESFSELNFHREREPIIAPSCCCCCCWRLQLAITELCGCGLPANFGQLTTMDQHEGNPKTTTSQAWSFEFELFVPISDFNLTTSKEREWERGLESGGLRWVPLSCFSSLLFIFCKVNRRSFVFQRVVFVQISLRFQFYCQLFLESFVGCTPWLWVYLP